MLCGGVRRKVGLKKDKEGVLVELLHEAGLSPVGSRRMMSDMNGSV